jgi:DNA-binding GntR family transcriptional regulator
MERTEDLLPQLDAVSRAELVAAAIERGILRGDLRAGDRLAERDLAERLGVSKTPVREALKVLARRGLVVSHAYRGTEVRTIRPEEARNIYQVRLLLEPEAVRLAAPLHDADSLRACRDALGDAGAAAERGEMADISLANRRFHRALYAPCTNDLLVALLEDVQDQVAMISVSAWRREATWTHEADEHEGILHAVESHDAESASELLRAHIGKFLATAVEPVAHASAAHAES